jgi:hypothetical protein
VDADTGAQTLEGKCAFREIRVARVRLNRVDSTSWTAGCGHEGRGVSKPAPDFEESTRMHEGSEQGPQWHLREIARIDVTCMASAMRIRSPMQILVDGQLITVKLAEYCQWIDRHGPSQPFRNAFC